MRQLTIIMALALVVAACSATDAATSTTSTAPVAATASSTTSTPTTTTEPETTTSISAAAHTPSTEVWGTWTLILASIDSGETGAEDQAREIASGIDGASVLYSSDFPSLNPDYWVVYWGDFESGTEAGNWCGDKPDELTCYPRFVGPDVSSLAIDDHAMVVDGQALAIVDVMTGERLKMFDAYFNDDGSWVGRMALTPDASALYYDLTWEDSWYACDSSRGQVWRLDLAFGTKSEISSGFSPAVSPDGRWLAVLLSEQCLPDPADPGNWVLTPTDTVVLYDLAAGRPVEAKRWSVGSPPGSYDDPTMVVWTDWRADSQALLVMNNAGNIYEIALDHQGHLDAGTPVLREINGYPQALVGDTLYLARDETPEEWGGFDLLAVDLATGVEGEVITETVGWPYAAADTTRTRLIWGSDTQAATAGGMFSVENYLGGFAW